MTPEQAAAKAAEALEQAAESVHLRVLAETFVCVADGWTRLYTALAHTPPTLPLMTVEPGARFDEGGEEELARKVEWALHQLDAQETTGTDAGANSLMLTADDVRAVLDSMKSNDHCEIAYHMEITQVREKIAEFAGDGGLILRRAEGETA